VLLAALVDSYLLSRHWLRDIRVFADDCILYREIRNSCDSASLQSDINKLCAWSYKWQMSFNVSKCCILCIHRKRPPPALNYILGNTLLNVANSHSYLGVNVSSDLRWHEHVNNISSKAAKTLNFIRHNVYCCPPDTLATAYISLVRPHLEYAAAAWELLVIVNSWKRCSVGLLVLLNETTDQRHRCLL